MQKSKIHLATYYLRLTSITNNQQLHESTSYYLLLTSYVYYEQPTTTRKHVLLLTTYALRQLRTTNNYTKARLTTYYLRLTSITNNQQQKHKGGSRAVRGFASLRCSTSLRTKPLPSLPQPSNR